MKSFEVGDYVKYIGWNPDYSGLNGTIKKVDNNSHVLMKFDDGRNLWAPFKQLSFKTEQIFSELDPYGEEYWDANESVKNFKYDDIRLENKRQIVTVDIGTIYLDYYEE